MAYKTIKIPEGGEKITLQNGKMVVPNHPIIPFVEGDGTGRWHGPRERDGCGERRRLAVAHGIRRYGERRRGRGGLGIELHDV